MHPHLLSFFWILLTIKRFKLECKQSSLGNVFSLGEQMKSPQFPCARKTGLVIQDMPDEVLVYDLDTNKAHCLNKSAAFVWRSCDGKTSVSDIARLFEVQSGDKVSDDFVWLALDQLNENALLESEVKASFAGKSR